MFTLMCPWTNGWAKSVEAGNLNRHGNQCGLTVMKPAPREICMLNENQAQTSWKLVRIIPPHSRHRMLNIILCWFSPKADQSCTQQTPLNYLYQFCVVLLSVKSRALNEKQSFEVHLCTVSLITFTNGYFNDISMTWCKPVVTFQTHWCHRSPTLNHRYIIRYNYLHLQQSIYWYFEGI